MTPPARTPGQRKHDTLNRLDHDVDAWVATAGPANGAAHLVPLSFLWDGTTMLIATPSDSVTSRNLQATGRARLGVGPTRDLVLIEGTVEGPGLARSQRARGPGTDAQRALGRPLTPRTRPVRGGPGASGLHGNCGGPTPGS
jgi:pyridoxamine 5'-phosphate oxidase-like protein